MLPCKTGCAFTSRTWRHRQACRVFLICAALWLGSATDPRTATTLYAATQTDDYDHFGLFKSTNGGTTWVSASDGLRGAAVVALAVDPSVDGTVYAATRRGVFTSSDGGASWHAANVGLPDRAYIDAVAVDATPPATVYAGGFPGVFLSTDSGATWKPLNTGLGADPGVLSLVIDPIEPAVLYAGTFARGVWTLRRGTECAGDCNGDGEVTVNELIFGVTNALSGCNSSSY